MTNESQIIKLIATDRLHVPVSSFSGKLKRRQPKIARDLGLVVGEPFEGDRAYARVEINDSVMKARGMKAGIDKFSSEFPRYGKILAGYIEGQRAKSETHVYFGMHEGRRLTQADYIGVMTDLGLSETTAMALYQPLMDVSRKLSRARGEGERSILIG